MSSPETQAPARPPVTVLCGFLGAGKTTLLTHVLGQAEGRRWAAVVNDVAAINIDAQTVAGQFGFENVRDVVSLGNGCVCCSSRDELAETVAELAAKGQFEHIFVETTGVAEPRGIAALFLQKNPFGRCLSDFAVLSALVTVVDAGHWLQQASLSVGAKGLLQTSAPRPIFELMVEQVECADLIVLNKRDTVGDEEAAKLCAQIGGLNTRAEILETERGQVASETLVDRVRFELKGTLGSAEWIQALNEVAQPEFFSAEVSKAGAKPVARRVRPRHEDRFGIGSFVFQARRPFRRERFGGVSAERLGWIVAGEGLFLAG